MVKILYAEKNRFSSTDEAIGYALGKLFNPPPRPVQRTKSGKPYIQGNPLFLSVSHTDDTLFLAFADCNIGIDAEKRNRKVSPSVLKRFFPTEREKIASSEDFLTFWTAKESAVKYLGGSLSRDLKHLQFVPPNILYHGERLGVITRLTTETHLLSLCTETEIPEVELLPLP